MYQWDEILPRVAHGINTRILRFEGSPPRCQNLTPDTPISYRLTAIDGSASIELELMEARNDVCLTATLQFELRLAKLDERRERAIERKMGSQKRVAANDTTIWHAPRDGDLVLLPRFSLDTQKGKKLEPR